MNQPIDISSPAVAIGLIALIVWEGVWKALALWRAARREHLVWFVVMCVVNTVGIVPIVYLLTAGRRPRDATDATNLR